MSNVISIGTFDTRVTDTATLSSTTAPVNSFTAPAVTIDMGTAAPTMEVAINVSDYFTTTILLRSGSFVAQGNVYSLSVTSTAEVIEHSGALEYTGGDVTISTINVVSVEILSGDYAFITPADTTPIIVGPTSNITYSDNYYIEQSPNNISTYYPVPTVDDLTPDPITFSYPNVAPSGNKLLYHKPIYTVGDGITIISNVMQQANSSPTHSFIIITG